MTILNLITRSNIATCMQVVHFLSKVSLQQLQHCWFDLTAWLIDGINIGILENIIFRLMCMQESCSRHKVTPCPQRDASPQLTFRTNQSLILRVGYTNFGIFGFQIPCPSPQHHLVIQFFMDKPCSNQTRFEKWKQTHEHAIKKFGTFFLPVDRHSYWRSRWLSIMIEKKINIF